MGICFLGTIPLTAQTYLVQPKTNVPYSRFGLGDPAEQFFAAAAGMAGTGASYNDYAHLNILNPASLGWLQVSGLETGFNIRYSGLRAPEENSSIWSGNINYVSLAFPIKNPINQALERQKNKFGWGMGVALRPYTNVGYNLESITETPGIVHATTTLKGSGGTYKVSWLNGIRLGGFSVGADAGFVFGKIVNNRRVTFDSLYLAYATELQDDISLRGFQWRLGAQYSIPLDKKTKKRPNDIGKPYLTLGGYLSTKGDFNTNTSRLYYRDNLTLAAPIDTFESATNLLGQGVLPGEFGFGMTFEKKEQLRLVVEYAASLWTSYQNDARPESLLDAYRVALAGEFTPDVASYNNYLRRVRYRAGFFYGTDPRSVNGEQILDYGLTLGAGLPIILPRQTTSYVNLALKAGQFGIKDYLRETYVQLNVGFTLNDNSWFFKRKFN